MSAYGVAGHFAGNEHSRWAGAALTALGLVVGWWVAAKLARSPTSIRVGALLAPFGLALLAAVAFRAPPPRGLRVPVGALNGTWRSQGLAQPLALRLHGDTAWLSAAAGPRNVAYGAAIRHDSLVLRAEEGEPLRWRIARDTTRHEWVLVAGKGLYFLKAPSQ